LRIPGGIESGAVFSPDGRYLLFAQQRRFEYDSEFGWTYRDSIRVVPRVGGRSKRLWLGPRPFNPEEDAEEGGNGPPSLSWQPLS
jgi:dipeptidyl aminopeptidase/acylaminoacyl peptidase